MPPPAPPDETHFSKNCRITDKALDLQSGHAHSMSCIQCELANLLLESMPPDPDLVDLIEQAFIEGQIDGQKADLAYLWLKIHRVQLM